MNGIRIRHLATAVMLAAAWCALWGKFSVANMASGLAVAAIVLGVGLGGDARGGLKLGPLMRLAVVVFIDLVKSTASVARAVLWGKDSVHEGIVAVELPASAIRHQLLLTCAVTLTPGTAVIDADPETGTIYLHLLHMEEVDEVREHVIELARLAEEAMPSRETTTGPADRKVTR